jgi:hypothetical protein
MVTRNRIQAHSSNGGHPTDVTKVLLRTQGLRVATAIWMAVFGLYAAGENPPDKPAEALYLQLGQVGLNPALVYQVRGASLDRSAVHITLEDGTIAFTQDVMGRITGAFFEGEGEVLLTPPSDVERKSMGLFTGMAGRSTGNGEQTGIRGSMGALGAESGSAGRHEAADQF